MTYARKRSENPQRRYGRYEDIQSLYSLGRASAMKIAKESGAIARIGRSVICDLDVIDNYINNQRLQQQAEK